MEWLGLATLWWLDFALVIGLLVEAYFRRQEGWARPAVALYVTVAVWYLGDVVYNSLERLLGDFEGAVIATSFLQVGWFLLAARLIIGMIWRREPLLDRVADGSLNFSYRTMKQFLHAMAVLWFALFLAGLINAEWDVLGVIWPPLREIRVALFAHSGYGSGWDFLIATGGYLYIALCGMFGVGFVLSRGHVRYGFALLMILAWPHLLFDRNRNVMLAILMPGIITYALFGRTTVAMRVGVMLGLAIVINIWFLLVGATRDVEGSVLDIARMWNGAISVPGVMGSGGHSEAERHNGLDMFLELCYMNSFVLDGAYEPNLGLRYLGELLNFVPRTIWPDKPAPGIDYAIARGFDRRYAESYTTVSTGIIGQGVANFGTWFGPVAAAALAAAWVWTLGRLWLQRRALARLTLFVLGMGLTFNLGRDITLLVLWPFVFAYVAVRVYEYRSAVRKGSTGRE